MNVEPVTSSEKPHSRRRQCE